MTRSLHGLLESDAPDVRDLLRRTAELAAAPPATLAAPLAGRAVAVLPLGPAAVPPAGWIAAAGRLGAVVLRQEDVALPGMDDLEVCGAAARWADLLVVSHHLAGFSRAVAACTGATVLNAGESAGEEPAAGLSLMAAALEAGRAGASQAAARGRPLRAAVCGDLRGSASGRSLLGGLAALDAALLLVPAKGRDLDSHRMARLARRMGRHPVRFRARSMRSLLDMVDTVLLTHEEAPQLPLFEEIGVPPGEAEVRARREAEDLDVLFVVASGGAPDRLVHEPFRGGGRARIPDGAAHEVGGAALGALLLQCLDPEVAPRGETPLTRGAERYNSPEGLRCVDDGCAAARLTDRVSPEFLLLDASTGEVECLHCGALARARFAASCREHRFHRVDVADAARIHHENLVLFRSRGEALAAGYEPTRRRRPPGAEETP